MGTPRHGPHVRMSSGPTVILTQRWDGIMGKTAHDAFHEMQKATS